MSKKKESGREKDLPPTRNCFRCGAPATVFGLSLLNMSVVSTNQHYGRVVIEKSVNVCKECYRWGAARVVDAVYEDLIDKRCSPLE